MKLEVIGSGSPEVLYPAPIETIWNSIGQTNSLNRILKRPDIGLSHRLLIASIVNLPADQRPWGIVTWLANFYRTSRQTIYTIANSILHPFLSLYFAVRKTENHVHLHKAHIYIHLTLLLLE